MTHPQLNQIRTQWANTDPVLRDLLRPIDNAEQYAFALAVFEQLMTEIEPPGVDATTLELYHQEFPRLPQSRVRRRGVVVVQAAPRSGRTILCVVPLGAEPLAT
ncbi:hypothetical protein E7T06_11900 [Deinococcus sp. Arct2-2]|uniref:hypothetical protein n=1 Tax=Deinococcus sp. Arct2-2 TaxID=2568653 RepID=UPI0010A5779C|nr:hypothetical protein [Deinococcus sp. Arct2-2]THF69494.1 hypothetical protein E7T06_11900 [Deinococcus sp. Arct2-2]